MGFILVNRERLPFSFKDKEGAVFNAMADFYHAGLDLRVEIKCKHLNGKTSKANAENAYARIEPAKLAKYPTHYQIQTQWNHSSVKHALVQSTIGAPQYVIAFTKQPDEATLKRIEKQGIQAYRLTRFAPGLPQILFLIHHPRLPATHCPIFLFLEKSAQPVPPRTPEFDSIRLIT